MPARRDAPNKIAGKHYPEDALFLDHILSLLELDEAIVRDPIDYRRIEYLQARAEANRSGLRALAFKLAVVGAEEIQGPVDDFRAMLDSEPDMSVRELQEIELRVARINKLLQPESIQYFRSALAGK
jgi:hypothetical protein